MQGSEVWLTGTHLQETQKVFACNADLNPLALSRENLSVRIHNFGPKLLEALRSMCPYMEVSLNYCSQNGKTFIGPRIIIGTQI